MSVLQKKKQTIQYGSQQKFSVKQTYDNSYVKAWDLHNQQQNISTHYGENKKHYFKTICRF